MGRKRRRRKPELVVIDAPKTGYFIEIIHHTPSGELRRTPVLWDAGIPTIVKLRQFVDAYRRVLRERKYIAAELGYLPDPEVINARRHRDARIVVSWSAANG